MLNLAAPFPACGTQPVGPEPSDQCLEPPWPDLTPPAPEFHTVQGPCLGQCPAAPHSLPVCAQSTRPGDDKPQPEPNPQRQGAPCSLLAEGTEAFLSLLSSHSLAEEAPEGLGAQARPTLLALAHPPAQP